MDQQPLVRPRPLPGAVVAVAVAVAVAARDGGVAHSQGQPGRPRFRQGPPAQRLTANQQRWEQRRVWLTIGQRPPAQRLTANQQQQRRRARQPQTEAPILHLLVILFFLLLRGDVPVTGTPRGVRGWSDAGEEQRWREAQGTTAAATPAPAPADPAAARLGHPRGRTMVKQPAGAGWRYPGGRTMVKQPAAAAGS
jgi:hypothetical protein